MQKSPITNLKGRYPFRLGTTSFIFPAGWAENVGRLAPYVDEIELLFFESQRPGSLPDAVEIDRLAEIAADQTLTYTIHLPVDVDLGDSDRTRRRLAVDTLAAIYRQMAHLPVTSYTLHLTYPSKAPRTSDDIHFWQERTRSGLEDLIAEGVVPQRLSIETLDYPFAWAAPLVETLDLRVCLDIGHLIIYAYGPSPYDAISTALDSYLSQTMVIHLHGVTDGKDHRPLDDLDASLLDLILERLRQSDYVGSLSLEVFGLEALQRSLECLEAAWPRASEKHKRSIDNPNPFGVKNTCHGDS